MYWSSVHYIVPILQAYDTVDRTLQRNIVNYFNDVNLRDIIDLLQSQVCTPLLTAEPVLKLMLCAANQVLWDR